MKKLVSTLVALAMLSSMTTIAFAAEDASEVVTEEDTAVELVEDKEEVKGEEKSEENLIRVDTEEAKQIGKNLAEKIKDAIKSGKVKESIDDMVESVANMKLENIFKLDSSKAATMATALFQKLEDWGIDLEDLYAKLKSSKFINWITSWYVPDIPLTTEVSTEAPTEAPTEVETETTTETTTDDVTVPTKEVVDEPATGSSSAIAAFAVMSVAAAAAFVSAKKKVD